MKETKYTLDYSIPVHLESQTRDQNKIVKEAHAKIIRDLGTQMAEFMLTRGGTDFYVSDVRIVKQQSKDSNFNDAFTIRGEVKIIDVKEAPQDQVEFHLQQTLLHSAHGLKEHWRRENSK